MIKATEHSDLVGIIGGTGPEASNYFASLLVKHRGHVRKDQDHIPFLLFNNPQIPDRSEHILYDGPSPLDEMIYTGLLLKRAGATFLVIPCHTAHAFAKALAAGVGLPVMSMVETTVQHIAATYGNNIKVGLLATNGTIKSRTYHRAFLQNAPGIELLEPDERTQTNVMRAIYEIKKFSVDEHNTALLRDAAQKLVEQGASIIILGCTEIPLALSRENSDFPLIDPMELLAKKVIKKAMKKETRLDHNIPPNIFIPNF